MKICYISNVDISLPNGPGVNEREFVWSLQEKSKEKGDHAYVVVPKPSKKLDFPLYDVTYLPAEKEEKRRLRYLFHKLLINWKTIKKVKSKAAKPDIDLFVIRIELGNILVPFLLLLYARRYAIKTFEKFFDLQGEVGGIFRKIFAFGLNPILRKVLRNAVVIDACTPQLVKNCIYIADHHTNVVLVENAVNVDRFYLMARNDCRKQCGLGHFSKIIGYCGGSPSLRGAKQLVRIAPELFRRHPDSGILIVGDDPDLWELKEEARKSRIADQIIFAGRIDYHKVALYMNCLDVGVALDSAERVGSIGNSSQKLRQYLACGVAVVFPKETNEAIMQSGLGMAVTPDDPEDLVEKICSLLGKTEKEIDFFRKKASRYACENLSTDVAYERRYAAWVKALGLGKSGAQSGVAERNQRVGDAALQ